MRITVPHYFDFGEERSLVGDDLARPEAWDAIRTESNGAFALPEDRGDWEALVDRHRDYAERAEAIDAVVEARGGGTLASYGVGVATLELWLHRLRPQRRLAIGEYAPATTARLRQLFPEADVHQHDLNLDPPLAADWHVFHRIDTEFTNRQWRRILERFRAESIVFVAGDVTDWRGALAELRRGLGNRNATRAGYVRNRGALEALWRRTHRAEPLPLDELEGWTLVPRDSWAG
ncbi:MAG: hypothetical protein M3M99_03850 [Actinomycetota bacterium]|nr:hypothetical protein [Actinomycetota bacterium]